MRDIVKRLRDAAEHDVGFGPLLREAAEAADEIERLRNELAKLQKATGQTWTEVSEGLPPDDGRWYWVHGAAFSGPVPAKRGYYDAGGWSNKDTWQDWGHDVERYCLIPKPPATEGGE